jgi:transposase
MPRYNNPRRTWRYSEEFKAAAVQMSLKDGIQVKEVAEALDIHPFMLSRWRKEYREGKIVADKRKKVSGICDSVGEASKVKRLEKEIARLKKENELLKKWQRFLAEAHQRDLSSSQETDNQASHTSADGSVYQPAASTPG